MFVDVLLSIAIVAVGGASGAVARFWLSGAIGRWIGETFPWGTLVVNVSGAALVGALAAIFPAPSAGALPPLMWLASVTGFLGGYTTVSSFSLQTLNLMRGGEWSAAASNVIASLLLSLGAAAAGFAAVTN
jgi:CrcB protein